MQIVSSAAAMALIVAAVAAATTLGDDGERPGVAGFRIDGDGSTVRGVAHFRQEGAQVTGFVVVWGLEPNSAHAVHFHGPRRMCGTKAEPVAVHPDLTADANGVAYTNVAITAETNLLGGGYYYNVHAGPSRDAENPEIACGDIEP